MSDQRVTRCASKEREQLQERKSHKGKVYVEVVRRLVLGSHLPQTSVIDDGKVCKAQSWGTPPVIRVRTGTRNWSIVTRMACAKGGA
jgi:hypothetical protein